MKKIILWVLMFFIYFIWQNTLLTFASGTTKSSDYERGISAIEKNLDAAKKKLDDWPPTQETIDTIKNLEKDLKTYEWLRDEAKKAEDSACAASGDCIDKASFMIETSLFSDGGKGLKWESSKATINMVLWTLIQKLMIALWIISLLIMTIGAGYMILYHGEDEYLSKWKSIFIAGIISLIVALSSYYIVNLVAYILYK